MTILRVAVVSDLHAFDSTDPDVDPPPSRLHTGLDRADTVAHPVSALLAMIAREQLTADLLLACGDLSNRASRPGLIYAWDEIQRIAVGLGGCPVIATAGNHDVDSRHREGQRDIRADLQELAPGFPTADDALNAHYWAWHYAIVDEPAYRVVTLNSAGIHGNPGEWAHGRIESRIVTRVMNSLAQGTTRPVQMLLCHHHPHRFGDMDIDDYSEMSGGQLLLSKLSAGDVGHWTIVHGHRHWPHLTYASGGGQAPTIFSAGSLTSSLYLDLQARARNQFYVIEFDADTAEILGAPGLGTFRSWDWATAIGWIAAQEGSGLPANGGFGYRANIPELATRVRAVLEGSGQTTMTWADILQARPEIRFLVPSDAVALRNEMQRVGRLNVVGEDAIEQVALR